MKLLLSGEGYDDIGDWAKEPMYRSKPPEAGVIEALLRKLEAGEITVREAVPWKKIAKFRAGDHAHPETRNVLGLAVKADDMRCDALVFVRDRDRDEDRQADIENGIKLAQSKFPDLAIAGGVAVEEIEAWILAILGERRSERHADPKTVLKQNHSIAGRASMLSALEDKTLGQIPIDATSLRTWLARAAAALSRVR
ncbi:MAG: hypothetical protein HUU21_15360 [Polyangiaceae bacterium]|nr:hypothetical protein [Polyangiaceae bacterium]